ncbi:MAG TPA: hypothetical protein VM307_02940 [Egibacteraceae bacterium]|nr:hypothetical protein [Egibacteraceae bacterium]
MEPADLSGQLSEARERYDTLVEGTDGGAESLLVALGELSTALEELQVANEELHTQAEELEAAEALIEAERSRYADLFTAAPDATAAP